MTNKPFEAPFKPSNNLGLRRRDVPFGSLQNRQRKSYGSKKRTYSSFIGNYSSPSQPSTVLFGQDVKKPRVSPPSLDEVEITNSNLPKSSIEEGATLNLSQAKETLSIISSSPGSQRESQREQRFQNGRRRSKRAREDGVFEFQAVEKRVMPPKINHKPRRTRYMHPIFLQDEASPSETPLLPGTDSKASTSSPSIEHLDTKPSSPRLAIKSASSPTGSIQAFQPRKNAHESITSPKSAQLGGKTKSPYFTQLSEPSIFNDRLKRKRKLSDRGLSPVDMDNRSGSHRSHPLGRHVQDDDESPDELEGRQLTGMSGPQKGNHQSKTTISKVDARKASQLRSQDISSSRYTRSGRDRNGHTLAPSESPGREFDILQMCYRGRCVESEELFIRLHRASQKLSLHRHETRDSTSVDIDPWTLDTGKIHRVRFGGPIVSLSLPRDCSGNGSSDPRCLIQFQGPEVVGKLFKELQYHNNDFITVPTDPNQMERELQAAAAKTGRSTLNRSLKLELELIKKRLDRSRSDQAVQSANVDEPEEKTNFSHLSSRIKDTSPKLSEAKSLKDFLDGDEKSKNTDRISTRVLRSRKSGGCPKDFDTPVESHPKAPEAPKYSETVGLGRRWLGPLIYPPTGSKRATVEFEDLLRLDEAEFLNDNIISFYLRFLEGQIEQSRPEIAKRIYMFNTYFYDKLAALSRSKGVNYEAVQKWTSKVDIFKYDFVLVPINERSHWYLALICNLPGLVNEGPSEVPDSQQSITEDGDSQYQPLLLQESASVTGTADRSLNETQGSFARMSLSQEDRSVHAQSGSPQADAVDNLSKNSTATIVPNSPDLEIVKRAESTPKSNPETRTPTRKGKRKSLPPPQKKYNVSEPIIITLDSLALPRSATIRNLKEYLVLEAKTKRDVDIDPKSFGGMTAKQIPLQDNLCDCGLYLLGYVEKFLEAPYTFVRKLLQREMDESLDWPKLQPSAMRDALRKRIMDLGKEQDESARAERKTKADARQQQIRSEAKLDSSMTKQSDEEAPTSKETSKYTDPADTSPHRSPISEGQKGRRSSKSDESHETNEQAASTSSARLVKSVEEPQNSGERGKAQESKRSMLRSVRRRSEIVAPTNPPEIIIDDDD